MIERVVVNVIEHTDRDGVDRWTIMTRNPDGTLHGYVLPVFMFPQLAAEYGFDPEDFDTLLDVAIHQCHIDDELITSTEADPVARSRGGRPVTLFNAESADDARAAHLERIEYVKRNVIRVVMPERGARFRVPVAQAADNSLVHGDVEPMRILDGLKAKYGPDMEMHCGSRKMRVRDWHARASSDLDTRIGYRRKKLT